MPKSQNRPNLTSNLLRKSFAVLIIASSLISNASATVSRRQSACVAAFAGKSSASAPNIAEILFKYRETKQAAHFATVIQTLPESERSTLKRILRGIYFIDYVHAAGDYLKLFLGEVTLHQTRFYDRYNEAGNPAFEKYEDGFRSLNQLRTPITLEKISDLHRATMINYEDNQGPILPGVYRQRFVYGPEFEVGLLPEQVAVVNANPYLFYMKATGIWGDTPSGESVAELNGRLRGAIAYPRDRDIRQSTLERIKESSPDVYARVLAYKAKNGTNYWNLDPQLTQDLTRALLGERLSKLDIELEKLSPLRTPGDVDAYINLIAQFQRDFISIHPFNDGNGRTSRLLLDYLCAKQGLPIPRLIYPNEDVYSTPDEWALKVKAGMLATLRLQEEWSEIIMDHGRLADSLQLLAPTAVFSETQKTEFINLIKLHLRNQTSRDEFSKNPVEVIERLKCEFLSSTSACPKN